MLKSINILLLRFVLICLIACIGLFISCKKNEGSPNSPIPCFPYLEPTHRIKEIVRVENGSTHKTMLYYDNLNRLKHITDSSKYFSESYYEYSNEKVLVLATDTASAGYAIILDSNGYATNNQMLIYHWHVDSSGYLVSKSESHAHVGSKIEYFSYSCFNNDSILAYVSQHPAYIQEGPFITVNEYYENQLNTIGNENMGISYYGKQDNCLVKSVIALHLPNKDILGIYTYEIDSLNRVTQEVLMRSDSDIRIRTFKYYDN